MKISVLGAGSWGTTLACLLANNGHKIWLWEINKELADIAIRKKTAIEKIDDILGQLGL